MRNGSARVRHYFDLCGRGEVAPILDLYAEDAIFFDCGVGPDTFVGREEIGRAVFEPLFVGLPDFSVTTIHMDGDDRRVLAEVILKGTHRGVFYGLPPTGRRLEWHSAGVWEMDAEGLFTREAYFYDSANLTAQLTGDEEPTMSDRTGALSRGR
jgi:steroid delta-isomerase-like uncharacterized protein